LKRQSDFSEMVKNHQSDIEEQISTLQQKMSNNSQDSVHSLESLQESLATLEKNYENSKVNLLVDEAEKSLNTIIKKMNDAGIKSAKTLKGVNTCINTEYSKYQKYLNDTQDKEYTPLQCPCCNEQLCITAEGGLEKYETITNTSQSPEYTQKAKIIASLKDELSMIYGILSTTKKTKTPLISEKEYLKQKADISHKLVMITTMQNQLSQLQSQGLPKSLFTIKNKLDAESKQFSIKFTSSFSEDKIVELQKTISEYESSLHSFKQTNQSRSNLEKNISNLEEKIQEIDISKFENDITQISEYEKSLSELQQKVSDNATHISKCQNKLQQAILYEEYTSKKQELENLELEQRKCQEKIHDLLKEMEGMMTYEDINKKAELLAIDSTITNINEHARVHLDNMFSDPICIQLETDTGGNAASGVGKLNIVVEYKGAVYANIEQLSGGERQRINLAFLLAINDMLGGRLLMLDECLNNLDLETNTFILDYLKRDDISQNRNILVVSHEAINGLFDNIVKI